MPFAHWNFSKQDISMVWGFNYIFKNRVVDFFLADNPDGDLGVWLACDPLEAKYPGMSPYNFVANSPLIFVDPDGEKVKLAGEDKSQKSYITKVNDLLVSFKIKKSFWTGNLKIVKPKGFNPENVTDPFEAAVYIAITKPGKGTISVVNNDPSVDFTNATEVLKNEFDIGDINNISKEDYRFVKAKIAQAMLSEAVSNDLGLEMERAVKDNEYEKPDNYKIDYYPAIYNKEKNIDKSEIEYDYGGIKTTVFFNSNRTVKSSYTTRDGRSDLTGNHNYEPSTSFGKNVRVSEYKNILVKT